jgi:adenylate cyclase
MRWPPLSFLRRFSLVPLVCFGLAWLVGRWSFFDRMEWQTLDWRTGLRAYFQPPPDPRIALILFEDASEAAIPGGWPPDRAYHGSLVELLSFTRPAVIAWDVILDTSREGDGDAKMALGVQAAMERGVAVVTAGATSADPVEMVPGFDGPTRPLTHIEGDIRQLTGDAYALTPFPRLRAVSWYGLADAPHEADGVQRNIPLAVRVGERAYPSLALQALMQYFHVPTEAVRVRLGDAVYLPTKDRGELRVPVSREGRYWLNYRYDKDRYDNYDFPTYPYEPLRAALSAHFAEGKSAVEVPDLAGKIIFVGQTVLGKADAGPTPRSALAPRTFIHVNLVDNVLRGDYVRRWPDVLVWGGLLAVTYLALDWLMRRPVWFMAALAVVLAALYAETACAVWIGWNLWLPVLGPLLGFTAANFAAIGQRALREQRAKQEIKGMFGTYVSPQLVERLIKSGEPPRLGGHEEELTAYFSDIQGFSALAEKLPPERLVGLLNEYLTACTDIVQEERGTLDKYFGDAVVAMFGAPIALPDHALRACVAAQRVQRRQGELRAKWQGEGDRWPPIVGRMQTRIGLNSGRCVVGNMGSRTRFNYTMMGDDVNLAARMESGAKRWGVYSMCTEATRIACERHGPGRLVFRPLGHIVVQGRLQPVPIHEIVGLAESVMMATHECIGLFAQGLERYHARDWDGALAFFQCSAGLEPNVPGQTPGVTTNPSLVYRGIAEHYKIEPPAENWDGVYVMNEK